MKALETSLPARRGVIFLVTFLALFQELLLIRWLGTQVRVIAYFPNVVLVAAFLGLGLGALRRPREPRAEFWPAALVMVLALGAVLGRIVFTQSGAAEHLWLLYYDLGHEAPVVNNIWLPLFLCFTATAVAFVPPGQFLGALLERFQAAGRPLQGYLWDLAGSLGGVAAFAAVTFAGWKPWAWFTALGAGLLLLPGTARSRLLRAALAAGCVFLAGAADRAERYTPYYALAVAGDPEPGAFSVLANGALHQVAFPIRRDDNLADPKLRKARDGFHGFYRFLPRPPRRVLVLGAGTGNDVAAVLDQGAERVDAVEIDPGILALGRRHPDDPYADPRVRVHQDDARAFLNRTREKYDLIIFGTLDSMTRLSALSNVRLDNFVYTRESIAAAKSRLAEDGGIALLFMVSAPYIADHIKALLTEAFDELPLTHNGDYSLFNTVFLAGPAFTAMDAPGRRAGAALYKKEAMTKMKLPTDDWPFLYLREATMPLFYWGVLAGMAAIALALIRLFAGARGLREAGRPEAVMFLFGAGFLLLETRAVTALGLLWGATWLTSTAVFASLLAMLVLSTALSARRPWPWQWGAVGIFLSLVFVAFAPVGALAGAPWPAKAALSLLIAGLPVFFAGITFAAFFGRHAATPRALAWNLFGAVVGGLAEFAVMALGLRALGLIALAVYLSAFWIQLRGNRTARGGVQS